MSYIIDEEGNKKYYQVNYVQKYYEDIFYGLLEEAYDVSLISHNERFVSYVKSRRDISSFYVMTLSILSDSIEDVYYDMTDVYYSNKVEYAIGSDLDDIGLIVGCPRPQATRAGVELVFNLMVPFDYVITIPEGILVSTNTGVAYSTVESVDVPIGETEINVYAVALEWGKEYRVEKETLNIVEEDIVLNDGVSVGLKVTNPKSSSGGRDEYSDEEYRQLLMNWVNGQIRGSEEAYERYFSSLDGLDSYKLIPNWNGITGTVKVVLDPGYPYQLQQVYYDLNGSVCQFPEDIVLFAPDYVPIDIYAVCDVDIDMLNPYSSSEKESIKSRVVDAIRTYIDGDVYSEDNKEYTGLELGEDFIPYKLGVYLSKKVPELKNIGFKYPSSPIKITDEQLGKSNDITIEMGSVQDYYNEWDIDGDDSIDYIGWR